MPGKLLILTYHGPGVLTGEDLRFKEAAIRLKMVSGDAMDEKGQNDDGPKPYFDKHARELLHDPRSRIASGVDVVTLKTTSLVTLNRLGAATWVRPAYERLALGPRPPTVFEEWLRKVFALPVEVLVLAGHHSGSLVWGAQRQSTHPYFPHSALKPTLDSGVHVEMRSFDSKPATADVLRAGPFDLSTLLKNCRLLVVLGCNGASDDISLWRDLIKKARGQAPWIFGFYGVHSMPRDADNEFVSPELWKNLAALAPGTPGSKNLDFLDDTAFYPEIRACWFNAVNAAFRPKSKRRHLFYSPKSATTRGTRGAGVIDPDGQIFWVINSAGQVAKVDQLP